MSSVSSSIPLSSGAPLVADLPAQLHGPPDPIIRYSRRKRMLLILGSSAMLWVLVSAVLWSVRNLVG